MSDGLGTLEKIVGICATIGTAMAGVVAWFNSKLTGQNNKLDNHEGRLIKVETRQVATDDALERIESTSKQILDVLLNKIK